MFVRKYVKNVVLGVSLFMGFMVIGLVIVGEVEDGIVVRLISVVSGLKVILVCELEVLGLYEVQSNNGDIIYIIVDGQYLLIGDFLKIINDGIVNVMEEVRVSQCEQVMVDFGDDQVIQFLVQGEEKVVISVFIDIDCLYCCKLYDEVL